MPTLQNLQNPQNLLRHDLRPNLPSLASHPDSFHFKPNLGYIRWLFSLIPIRLILSVPRLVEWAIAPSMADPNSPTSWILSVAGSMALPLPILVTPTGFAALFLVNVPSSAPSPCLVVPSATFPPCVNSIPFTQKSSPCDFVPLPIWQMNVVRMWGGMSVDGGWFIVDSGWFVINGSLIC